MGRIVGAFATSHILMSRSGCADRADNVLHGMQEIGRRIRALDPDVIIVVASDHMFNFSIALQAPIMIGVAESYVAHGDMDIPKVRLNGQEALSRQIVRAMAADDFDLAQMAEYAPDHGIMVPLVFGQITQIPIIPIIVNVGIDPFPSARRCFALGQSLRRATMTAESGRAVVLGTGGLSHWIFTERHGEVDEAWDHTVMAALAAGRQAELASWSNEKILHEGGNGGAEIVNWIATAAVADAASASTVYYEAMPEWMTGMGGMEFHVR